LAENIRNELNSDFSHSNIMELEDVNGQVHSAPQYEYVYKSPPPKVEREISIKSNPKADKEIKIDDITTEPENAH
jgi:hypothetical protein